VVVFEFRSENPILDIYRRYLADKVPALSNEGKEAADVKKKEHYTGANNITLPSVADLEDYLQQADSGQQFSLLDEFPSSNDDAADQPVTIGIRPSALLADLQVSVNDQLVENSIDSEQDTDFENDKPDLEEGLQALQSAQKSIVPDGFSDIYAEYVKQKAKSDTEASVAPGSLLGERAKNFFSAIVYSNDHNPRGATGMLQRHQLDGMELPSTHEMDAYCKAQGPERELWQDGSNTPSSENRFTPDKIDQLTDDMLATPGLSPDQYQALVRRMGADQVVDRFCDTEHPLSLCPDAIAALNNGDNAPSRRNRQRMIERLYQKPMTRDAATALASIKTKKIPEQARGAVKNSLSQYLKAFSNDHKSKVLDQDEYAHLFNVFDQYSQLSLSKKERQDKDKISELFYDLHLDPAFIQQLPKKEQSIVNKAYKLYGVAAQAGAFNGTTLSVGAGEVDHEVGAIVKSNVPVGLPSGSSSSMVLYTPYNNGSVLPIDLGDHPVFPGAGNGFYGRSPNDQNLFDFPKDPVPTEFRPLEDFTPSELGENALNIAYKTDTPPVQSTSAPEDIVDAPPGQPTRGPSSVQAKTKIIEADTKLNKLYTLLDSATNDSPTVTKIETAINEIAPSNATASDPDQPSVLMTDSQQNKFTQLQEKAPRIIEKLQTESRHATQNFFDKSELADSLKALDSNSNAYKACLQNAKDNLTQEDFKLKEQALIDTLPDQISDKLDAINQLSSSDEQQLQALQAQINTASALSENSPINETIAGYGQQVKQALAHLDQMTEYQSQYDKLANQESAEAIAGLDSLITTLESEISENKLPDDAETLKTNATERLTEKLEAQTPVKLGGEGLVGLEARQAAIQSVSNPRIKTRLKDALNAQVEAYAGQIKQSMASDPSRVSKTTIQQLTSLLNASNDIDTQSSIISQLGNAFQDLKKPLDETLDVKGANLDVEKSPAELSQFKSMIDQNNEVIKFIQETEPALASEPSLLSEFLKGLARDSVPGMPKSDMERLDHARLTARTQFSEFVRSMQAADRILNDKTTELIQNQVNEALPDLQKMSPEAIEEALNSLPGQTSTSLQKQEPTVANRLHQAKHDALTTQLDAIDAVRKAAETAVKNVVTQVEKAQSPQKLQEIRRSISDKITPDPVTGTDQAQNAVYQAVLTKVDEKIQQFQTNQQNLDTAIENLPEIPEQSEQPSLTKQNEQIKALEVAIQFVTAAQQKPGTELNDEQRQKIEAQKNRLVSLQSTFNQGEKAVKNIRALTNVNEIGVTKSSDPLTLDDVVNNHAAVVKRRKQLQSSQTQAAIGLDRNLGEPVKQAIKTLDARRNELEDDYVKLQTEAYGNQVTAIQEGVSSGSSVQGAFKAFQEAASMLIGPAKENTATSNTISSLDNDIQALHEKNEAIKKIPTRFFDYDDNILTSHSAKNSTDESNQEASVPLSGQLAALGKQSIAANQEKIDALNIEKGTLRAQQFADDKLTPKNDDSDLDALVSRFATIQSQLKGEMLVDNDEKITQGYQEQLGITLAEDTQSLKIAYTHYADKNKGLINSEKRQDSIKNMTLDQLEAAQADLTLMENALALQTDGNPILEIDGQSLDDTLRAVKTAIEHRSGLNKVLESLASSPDNPKGQIGMIQYANELLRTKNDVDDASSKHLQKVAGKAIATCQNALLPSASTAVFAQKGAQDWLKGVLGDEAKAPPAYDTLFTEEQKQLLNSVQQLGSIKNAMADALSNDASDVAFTNAAEALKAYDTAEKFETHVDGISNTLPEGAGDLKQQLAGLTEQYSQVQTRLQTYAEDRKLIQAYQGKHNEWNKSLSAALKSPGVTFERLETLLSQKPKLPTLSEFSQGVIDQSNSNLEEQAQDVISKVNEQLPAVPAESALSKLSDDGMTQLRNQNTSPEIEKPLSAVGQDSLQGRMLSNRRTTNNAKIDAEFDTRDRLKHSFDEKIGLHRPTDDRNLGETLVKMDAENLGKLQASLNEPNDAIFTEIIKAGEGETDRDERIAYLKGYSEDLGRQISGQLAVRQQAVKTTQATLNETITQIREAFPLDATELTNPTEVGKARALLSAALRDYGNACGWAGVQVPESDQSEDNPDVGPVSALRKQLQNYSDMYALNQAILKKRNGIAPADMKEADLAAYKEALQGIEPAQESPDAVKNLYDAEITAIDDAESSLNKLRQRFINDVVGYTPVVADEKGDFVQVPSSDVVDGKGHSTKALSDALQDLYNQVHSESVDDAKAKLRDAVSQLSDSDRLSLNKSLSRLDIELSSPGNQYIKLDQSAREIQTLMRKQLNRVKNTKESEQAVEKFYKEAFNELDGKNVNANTLDDLSGAQLLKLQSVLSDKKTKYTDKDKIGLMQTKIAAVTTQLTEREEAYAAALKDNDALNESQPDNSQLASIRDGELDERIKGLRGRIVELTKLADRAGIEDHDRTAIQAGNDILNALQAEQSARTDYAGYNMRCKTFNNVVSALEKERHDARTASACKAIDEGFVNLKTPELIATNKLPARRDEAVELIKFEKPDPRIALVEARNTEMSEINKAIKNAVIPDGDLASASIADLQASDGIMQEQLKRQDELIKKPDYDSIMSFEDLEPRATAQHHDARIQAISKVLTHYEGLETRINECQTQEALDAISLDDLSGVINQDQDDRIDPNQQLDIAAKKTELAALKTQKSEQLSEREQAARTIQRFQRVRQSVQRDNAQTRIAAIVRARQARKLVDNVKLNKTAAALDENSWFLFKTGQLEAVATLVTGQNNSTHGVLGQINQAVGVANSLNAYIDSANNSVVSTSSNVNQSTPVNSNSSGASKLDGPSEDEQALITKVAGYLRDPTPESAPTPDEALQAIKIAENNTAVKQALRGAYAENKQKPENTDTPGTDDEQSPYNFITGALLGAGVLVGLGVSSLGPTGTEVASNGRNGNATNTTEAPNGSNGNTTDTDEPHTATLTAVGTAPQVNPDTMDCAVRVTCFLEDNTRNVKKYDYDLEEGKFNENQDKSDKDLPPESLVKSVEGKWNPADPNDRNVEEAAYRAAKAFLNNNTRQKMTMPACDATKRQIVLKGVSRCIEELKKEENTTFNPKARLGASLLRELSKAARTSNQNRLSELKEQGTQNQADAKQALSDVNKNGNQSKTPTVKNDPGANGNPSRNGQNK
jgi:hypothetical protein